MSHFKCYMLLSVLLFANVERFSVSDMRDLLLLLFLHCCYFVHIVITICQMTDRWTLRLKDSTRQQGGWGKRTNLAADGKRRVTNEATWTRCSWQCEVWRLQCAYGTGRQASQLLKKQTHTHKNKNPQITRINLKIIIKFYFKNRNASPHKKNT